MVARMVATLLFLTGCSTSKTDVVAPEEISKCSQEIEGWLQEIAAAKRLQSMVVATVKGGNKEVCGFGKISEARAEKPTAETIYQIGSLTKTMTGYLLADAVQKKVVSLEDTIGDIADGNAGVSSITFSQLVTHRSGLPRMPGNGFLGMSPTDRQDPFASYTWKLLVDELKGSNIEKKSYEYSNMAVGLLGELIARKYSTTYRELLKQALFVPAQMTTSVVSTTDSKFEMVAPPHVRPNVPYSIWHFDVIAPAGAVNSNVSDLIKYGEFLMKQSKAGHPALELIANDLPKVGYGWHEKDGVLWHNGSTLGSESFMSLDPQSGSMVIVLSNSGAADIVTRLGFSITDSLQGKKANFVVIPPSNKNRKSVAVGEEVLKRYVGDYKITDAVTMTVSKRDTSLWVQVTGQNAVRLYPSAIHTFFIKELSAEGTFQIDNEGQVTGVLWKQSGQENLFPKK